MKHITIKNVYTVWISYYEVNEFYKNPYIEDFERGFYTNLVSYTDIEVWERPVLIIRIVIKIPKIF